MQTKDIFVNGCKVQLIKQGDGMPVQVVIAVGDIDRLSGFADVVQAEANHFDKSLAVKGFNRSNQKTYSHKGFSKRQREYIYYRDKGICQHCGTKHPVNGDWHADHITPHSKGGDTIIENGQLLCATCNLKKSNKVIR